MSISVLQTAIAGALVIVPPVFTDERGSFKETYVRSKFLELGITDDFVQDNVSVSQQNVIRGLHGDRAMSKLVQVLYGEAYDVIVDARSGSPSFGKWEAFHLSASNSRQLYIPAGCLHGFQALSGNVVFAYKQNAEYDPSREIAALWNDETLSIDWPRPEGALVSQKDRKNKPFIEVAGA